MHKTCLQYVLVLSLLCNTRRYKTMGITRHSVQTDQRLPQYWLCLSPKGRKINTTSTLLQAPPLQRTLPTKANQLQPCLLYNPQKQMLIYIYIYIYIYTGAPKNISMMCRWIHRCVDGYMDVLTVISDYVSDSDQIQIQIQPYFNLAVQIQRQ